MKNIFLRGGKALKIITIGTLKGGTGKTSTVFNLGGILAEQYKVLMIDVDPQANLSTNCGVDVTRKNLKTINNIFENREFSTNIIFEKPIRDLPNLDIIPSSLELTRTEMRIVSQVGRENVLKNFIYDNKETLSKYDYILIDTSPLMGIINQNAFLIADSLILVSDVSGNSIQGAELFIALWDETRTMLRTDNNIKALILNNCDKRTNLPYDLIAYCKENESLKDIILDNIIYNSVKVKHTELEHKPINILYKNSNTHASYKKILEELNQKEIF